MADSSTNASVKSEPKVKKAAGPSPTWHPFDSLRHEVNRLFEEFDTGSWRSPFRGSIFGAKPFSTRDAGHGYVPTVDIVEREDVYDVAVELPGLDEKDVSVKLAGGLLTISGEKQENKEEKRKDYYLQERSFGAFERSFRVPEGVDAGKIGAHFAKGVLTVTLPKTAEAKTAAKTIEIKGS
jgi:HSP20 family protein